MAYTDITQTGGHSWQELQDQNNSQFQGMVYDPYYTEFMQSDIGVLHGNPSELVEIGSSINDPIPWGASRYDRNPTSLADYTERNNRRAYNQPTILQWFSGAAKFLTTAGSTALSSTLGTVVGLAEGTAAAINAKEGEGWTDFWHKFSNNQVNKAMADFSAQMENVFVNYYTDYERTAPWWKNLGTANFWADGVLKNAGFTAGAVAAAYAWGAVLPFLGTAGAVAGTGSKVKGVLGGFAKMALGSIGEANIESIHATDEMFKTHRNGVKQATQFEYQKAQNQYRIDLLTMSHADASAKYQMEIDRIDKEANQLLQNPEIEKSIKEAGNAIFGLNFALLSLTNTFEVSNLLKGGKTWSRQIASNAVKPTLKETGEELTGAAIGKAIKQGTMEYTADLLQKPWLNFAGRALATGVTEGFIEEGGQGWISSSEKLYGMSKWRNTPIMAYMATDFFPEVVDRASAYNKAFQEQYGTADGQGWQEIAMGFIGGILGAPFFGRKQKADGTSTWGFQWIGGLKNAYDETIGQDNETKQFLQQINSQINDPKFIQKFYAAAGLMQSDAEALDAIRRGDIAAFKQEEFNAIAQQVNLFTSLGRVDDLINIYKGLRESFSEEDIPVLQEATGLDLSAYTKEEIIEEFKGKADTTLQKIEAYRNSVKAVTEFMEDPEFKEVFKEYLNDPMAAGIIKSQLAFTDANIVELNRRKQNVESKLNKAILQDPNSVEVTQLQKDLKDIDKQLEKAQGLDYAKKHLTETKQEFDKIFDYLNKVAVGKDIARATESLGQATTLQEVVENFKYLDPDIKDQVVNGVKDHATPELKNIIEKYQEFERIQNIIKDSLKNISEKFNYLGLDEQSKKTLTEIYQTEFQRAVDQTLMTNLDSLNAETLKDNIEESLNNQYLDNSEINDFTKFLIKNSLNEIKQAVDTAFAIPTPLPASKGSIKVSEGCKYESIDCFADNTIKQQFEETPFNIQIAKNMHEQFDTYYNILFNSPTLQQQYIKAEQVAKDYLEKHPDATIKDVAIMLCRDVLQNDVIESIFVAQVVCNKVNAHPVPPITSPTPTPAAAPAPVGVKTQAPVTTPQSSSTQNQQPEKPDNQQLETPQQAVFMLGDVQVAKEWAKDEKGNLLYGIEHLNHVALPQWLLQHGYDLDLMRTKYLRYIKPGVDGTPIHFICLKEAYNITGLSKMPLTPVFLAVKVSDLPDGVVNESSQVKTVTEIDGEKYILIGTYGATWSKDPKLQSIIQAQNNHFYNKLRELQSLYTDKHESVVSPHTTRILDRDGITYGRVVIGEQDKNGNQTLYKSEVSVMLANPNSNPLGFTQQTLPFFVNYGVSQHITEGYAIEDVIGGQDLEQGQVYILLPVVTPGKYIPFKINTVTLADKKEAVLANTKFKTRLLQALSGLVDTELGTSKDEEQINKTLNAAKQEIFKYLKFKDNAMLGYSKPQNGRGIQINLYGATGGVIQTLLDLSTVTTENKAEKVQELFDALLALDETQSPQINIEGAWITNPLENNMYFGEDTINGTDSLLTTDTKTLAIQHNLFNVYAVDKNGNMVTSGFTNTGVQQQKPSNTKLPMKVYTINGVNYRYWDDGRLQMENGTAIPYIDNLYNIVQVILNGTPFTIKVGNTEQTYLPFGPNQVIRIANKSYILENEETSAKVLAKYQQQSKNIQTEEKAQKIVEQINQAEETVTEEKVEETPTVEPVEETNTEGLNLAKLAHLTGLTQEECQQRIELADKAKHQNLYIPTNSLLAKYLYKRIAAQLKAYKKPRPGFGKSTLQVPTVLDSLHSLMTFINDPANKEFLTSLGLQDKSAIDILTDMINKHPNRDYDFNYTDVEMKNFLDELVNCK